MKIGHCQMACATGDVATNLNAVLRGLAWAAEEKLAIVSFPESFLTGYFDSKDSARCHMLATDGPEIAGLLTRSKDFTATFMVGYNEARGREIYNTVLIAEQGRLLGTYSKAFPCHDYFTPGRDFPVFERDGVPFGVVICADGGYIEPTRILALKGAQIVFAPHYNYIGQDHLIDHFQRVRRDHAARAVENDIFFFRGNNYVIGHDAGLDYDGVGYGDSYLVDPNGEILIRSRRMTEHFMAIDIDPSTPPRNVSRSAVSADRLLSQLKKTLAQVEGPAHGAGMEA